MKHIYITFLTVLALSFYSTEASAQFIVAQDTVRGSVDFCPRLGDLNNSITVPNDSVFYMFPADAATEPWRYVDYYLPSRSTKSGYIGDRKLMRIDDYDIIEVERLSSHGTISFKNDDVRVNIAVSPVTTKDTAIKKNARGEYIVNDKPAKGVARGQSPQLKYQSISVTIKGHNIVFPKGVYEHLLDPEIDNMIVYYNADKSIVYISANNGGTAAYYNALWAVSPRGVANVYIFDPAEK
ncbi:hypothetical protein M2451_000574 [Dysgonomonas sp. PFB1-18]|uniref:hypothetical protein n=1 Tax=unclassified Dysgonomonas TaxID=2630389 RepID=UPI002473752D|nr:MULTISPECIES: hypothetical protein [unclassified Dysgonomonas]MDH6307425.1 hypothetical protein [Dysgonomonas sp. PF1-14]MDH6337343.1 hypothetical protein [Dysgonomonas sp. PF1-16]MDH6379267.1 hypothetical protein [Dysgonomonas sp. PFB1-18]MDH6396095.1 hypothetical protein [Dysgonomonas sp. PF1-23]